MEYTSSDSESGPSWIEWFLSQKGNEYFCAVDKEFILDLFNLQGLKVEVEHFQLAINYITDNLDHELSEEIWNQVEDSAIKLYGLIHARWVLTNKGLYKMSEKMKRKEFGKCPRVLCEEQAVIPVGLIDMPRQERVRLYCPECEDIYTPRAKKHQIDGAYFTTSLPHLLLQMFPALIPQKSNERYVPKIFGFKVHNIANEHRKQDQLLLSLEE